MYLKVGYSAGKKENIIVVNKIRCTKVDNPFGVVCCYWFEEGL
jgi:hypothetical protein